MAGNVCINHCENMTATNNDKQIIYQTEKKLNYYTSLSMVYKKYTYTGQLMISKDVR